MTRDELMIDSSQGGGVGSLDHTILAEANGLIADMLMDPGMPPNITSGLKALQILLCPSQQNKSTKVAVGQKVELAPLSEPGDIDDCEEIPFTGEKPSDMSKVSELKPFGHADGRVGDRQSGLQREPNRR